jgi:hypothetical protein
MNLHKSFSALLLSGALALTAMLAAPVSASDSESMLRLNIAATTFKSEARSVCRNCGYCRPYARSKGFLSEGGSYTINTTLYKGYDYVIIGAGDSSVKDLDLEIYDENWNLINRDTERDALPVVKSSPRWNGRFHIRVKMYEGSGYPNVAICHVQPD